MITSMCGHVWVEPDTLAGGFGARLCGGISMWQDTQCTAESLSLKSEVIPEKQSSHASEVARLPGPAGHVWFQFGKCVYIIQNDI